MNRATVIGAGVTGLTTAIELRREYEVTVVAAAPALSSTSGTATAIWHVYLVDPNDPSVLEWSRVSLEKFLHISRTSPEAGVTVVRGIELFRRTEKSVPTWRSIPPLFRMIEEEELRLYPGASWGYEIAAPLAQMHLYLPWLERLARSCGVKFTWKHVESLNMVGDACDVVVNCTGLGARALVSDEELVPVRGQYLVLDKPPSCPEAYIGDDDNPGGMTYVIPRPNDICVGGTEEYGVEDVLFEVNEEQLIDRASDVFPWLKSHRPQVLQRIVGLRPFRRAGVRLEVGSLAAGTPVIHNYGHGGSGFSLSWGCAAAVRHLAADIR